MAARPAHAAMSPWKGRDALDAVVLMDSGMAQYREHLAPGMNMHRVITDGGVQPNVIPSRAAIWWFFRNATAEGAKSLYEQALKVAEGAAMMTNTELSVEIKTAVWPVRGNQVLAEALQRGIEATGMPDWDEGEHQLSPRPAIGYRHRYDRAGARNHAIDWPVAFHSCL